MQFVQMNFFLCSVFTSPLIASFVTCLFYVECSVNFILNNYIYNWGYIAFYWNQSFQFLFQVGEKRVATGNWQQLLILSEYFSGNNKEITGYFFILPLMISVGTYLQTFRVSLSFIKKIYVEALCNRSVPIFKFHTFFISFLIIFSF